MRLSHSSTQVIEETTTPMPSNPNFIFLPVGQAPVPLPRRFKQNPSSLVVPLPSLMAHRRATHTRIQDLKFDICVCWTISFVFSIFLLWLDLGTNVFFFLNTNWDSLQTIERHSPFVLQIQKAFLWLFLLAFERLDKFELILSFK